MHDHRPSNLYNAVTECVEFSSGRQRGGGRGEARQALRAPPDTTRAAITFSLGRGGALMAGGPRSSFSSFSQQARGKHRHDKTIATQPHWCIIKSTHKLVRDVRCGLPGYFAVNYYSTSIVFKPPLPPPLQHATPSGLQIKPHPEDKACTYIRNLPTVRAARVTDYTSLTRYYEIGC